MKDKVCGLSIKGAFLRLGRVWFGNSHVWVLQLYDSLAVLSIGRIQPTIRVLSRDSRSVPYFRGN